MIFNKSDNGTNEIADIATWTASHDYTHISKALILAKRKVLKIIDKKTYQLALTHYLSDNYKKESPTKKQTLLDQLVNWFQIVFVNFAYEKNLAKDTVIWDNAGINVTWSEQFRPAQQTALDSISDSLNKDAYEFLDLLIEFLNDNPNTFTDFHKSIENLKLKELFINDAEDFSHYFNIYGSVSYFFSIIPTIRRVQRSEIFNALQSDYYNKVLDYQSKRLELENVTDSVDIIDNLPPAVSNGTIYLVENIETFYKFKKQEWFEYAYDARRLLQKIKPALVDFVMYNKYFSDVANLKATAKQIEIVRANANILKEKADTSLSHIIQFIGNIKVKKVDSENTPGYTSFNSTKNSFML